MKEAKKKHNEKRLCKINWRLITITYSYAAQNLYEKKNSRQSKMGTFLANVWL